MSKMASFLAGLGGGYIQAKDKALQQKRQDEQDAWMREQRDRQRAEWKEADQIKLDLRDAAAPRTTMSGYLTQSADGQKLFSADAGQVAQLKSMQDSIAELEGVAPATQTQGHAITGNMSKGHQIGAGAAPDVSGINSTDSVVQRMAGVHMRHGNADKALLMENAVMDQKAKRLGLKREEAAWAQKEFNDRLSAALSQSGSWTDNAAKLLTETQVGGLAGVTISPKISTDGKTVTFVATGPDGQAKEVGSYENSEAGKAKFLQGTARVPLETQIGWLAESEKRKIEASEREENKRRWELQYGLEKQKHESDQQYRVRMLQLQGAQEARAAEAHRVNMQSAKIPPAVKMQAESLAKQIEGVNTALNKAMAEGNFDPNNPGTARLLERQAALGIQYTQLITPFAPGASATPADPLGLTSGKPPEAAKTQAPPQQVRQMPPQPPARPMSAFEERRQRAIQEEAERRKAQAEAEAVRREQERQRQLQGRPDLQQMGGMRYFN